MVLIGDIHRIELVPVTETESPELQGFHVTGFKRSTRRKTGFLINSIRSMNIEQSGALKVRTRISWIPDKKVMEIEEQSARARRMEASIILFRVNFDDLDKPRILEGKPWIVKNAFRGKSIEINWSPRANGDSTIITVKSVDNRNFSCKLDRKVKTIDVQIEY